MCDILSLLKEKDVIIISTYYMKNKAEMVNYAGEQTKSIIVTKEIVQTWSVSFFDVKECYTYLIQLYTSDTPNSKYYGDAVYVNKRTLKAYLRHLTGLSVSELNDELFYLSAKYFTPKREDIWDKKVILKCNLSI